MDASMIAHLTSIGRSFWEMYFWHVSDLFRFHRPLFALSTPIGRLFDVRATFIPD